MTDLLKQLQAPLDASRVCVFGSKAGAKSGLSYLEGHDVINEMNKVFDFRWSNQVSSLNPVLERPYERNGKKMIEVAYTCIVQVAIEVPGPNDTLYKVQHDGVGGGSSSMPEFNTAEAHEFAAKNAETDALKRACMKIGDRFGLALYEKDQSRVEAPFDHKRAKADLLHAIIKEHNLGKTDAVEHIQLAIKTFNDGKLVPFETFDAEQAASIKELAVKTQPKESK